MTYNPEDVITFAMREHAQQFDEIERLKKENAQLRALLAAIKPAIEKILKELETTLDEDSH